MQPPNENPTERGAIGGAGIVDLIGVEIEQDLTSNFRPLQALRIASRFGLQPSTAAVVAELAFPALVTIGGGK